MHFFSPLLPSITKCNNLDRFDQFVPEPIHLEMPPWELLISYGLGYVLKYIFKMSLKFESMSLQNEFLLAKLVYNYWILFAQVFSHCGC